MPLNSNTMHLTLNNGPTNMGFNDFYLTNKALNKKVISLSLWGNNKDKYALSANGNLIYFIYLVFKLSRKVNVIHIHSHHLAFLVGILRPCIFRKKIIYTVHTSYGNLKKRNRFFYYIGRLLSSYTVFVGDQAYNSFPNHPRNNSSIIRNGIHMPPTLNFRYNNEHIKIIILGRLCSLKRPIETMTAIAHSKINKKEPNKQKVTIIGDGDLSNNISELVINNKIQNCKILGKVERKEVYKNLEKSDLYISYSSIEGLPIAALEAASYGCYLILSNIPPHKEISELLPHVTLVESNLELKNAIDAVSRKLLIDKNYITKVKNENSRACSKNFNIKEMINKYENLYIKSMRR